MLTINKGEMDEDEIKEKISAGARAFMESSGLYKLPGHKSNETDCGLWKRVRDWWCDGGKTLVLLYKCPLAGRFDCKCQVKITENLNYHLLETRGEHNEECHNPTKDKSKFLKLKQLDAIQTGVRVSPQQSARELRRNLVNLSPDKRVGPKLMRCLQRRVVKVRAELTLEQLDQLAIDDSFGSLVRYAEAKWFPTLFEKHMDDTDFHLGMHDVFVLGKCIDAANDIVYLNFSSLWHLCNVLRNMEAGWLLQLNGDATFNVCRRTVALYSFGVNSLGNVNNPICWAIIPETESAEVLKGLWKAVQDAVILIIRHFKPCADICGCEACAMVANLLACDNITEYKKRHTFAAGVLEVDQTLSDHSLGFGKFTRDTFSFDANMCRNHVTAIPAANHSQQRQFKSRETYDRFYDEVVRFSQVGHEAIAVKCDEAMIKWISDVLEDPVAAEYYNKTWSLASGHGRFPVVYGGYGGSTTNGATEAVWKDKRLMSIKSAKLGTFIGGLVHTIECRGEEHSQKLHEQGDYNRFISFPPIKPEIWPKIMAVHPKTLACTVTTRLKEDEEEKISNLFDGLTNEIFENGHWNGALHHKISSWHEENSIAEIDKCFSERSVGNVLMPTQRFLNEIDADNSRDVEAVRQEIWRVAGDYRRLMDSKDTSYKSMHLPEILDVYAQFHSLEYRGAEWSTSNWGCTCVLSLRDCICSHATLMTMLFDPAMEVPDSVEESIPSARKIALKRGIAGSKRKKYLAARAAQTKNSCQKAKRFCPVGPMVLYLFYFYRHVHTVPDSHPYRTLLRTRAPRARPPTSHHLLPLASSPPPSPHLLPPTPCPPLLRRQ